MTDTALPMKLKPERTAIIGIFQLSLQGNQIGFEIKPIIIYILFLLLYSVYILISSVKYRKWECKSPNASSYYSLTISLQAGESMCMCWDY